ncbi:MAG: peptide-methionine (S)-S-oxide reductase [Flavobacteriaceae bacterium]|uniref:peptide-methionine (S)-S-oxide reductase n=1 Tax=uncultured Eudoraea sp. TaxID=1035614 RepID=UPI002606DB49|nr:peptide-methionine (S)-S-oxide reductase [uncultured Eudoraea sp.]
MLSEEIGFGGSCHWCTEAIFQTLKGVSKVRQGWISIREDEAFHEGVIVEFRPDQIPLKILIEVHLLTHSSTSEHKLRKRYRSAIYAFSSDQQEAAKRILLDLQKHFTRPLITKSYRFKEFKTSAETFQNYYRKNPDKPFCKSYIDPKLKLIFKDFSTFIKS